MTRSEFLEDINSWYDLLCFCSDEDCDVCEDIYSQDDMDEQINDDLLDYVRNEGWETVRDALDNIPTGYDYYRCNDRFDYDGMNDDRDFNGYKDEVLEWMDNGGYWDAEDEEDVDCADFESTSVEDEPEEDEPPVEAEDFSVNELFGMCFVSMATIKKEDAKKEAMAKKELDAAFAELSKTFRAIS